MKRSAIIAWLLLLGCTIHAQQTREVGVAPTFQFPSSYIGPNGGVKIECLVGCAGGGTLGTDVNVTDRALRLLGKITFDGTQDTNVTNLPTAASASALAVRCVNTAGNAFESCGGAGGSASTVAIDQTTNGTTNAVYVNNFPASQAVTGTFWQATQPVSGTVGVNNFPASQAVTGTFWPTTAAAPSSTRLSNGTVFIDPRDRNWTITETVPVSGTFWQTTQPVSIATMPSTPVTGTFWQATQPVSGTFWQATQPVSGTVGVNNFPASQAVTGTFWQAVQPVSQAAITKGTQGTSGVTTQDLKDAGRNQTNYYMTLPIVTSATDALQSLTGYKGGAAVTATTTPAVVTTGKTYRVQSITITYVAIATAGSVKFTLRANTAGVVAIGSPAVSAWVVGGPAAVAGVSQTVNIAVPDGMEFAAGTGIGVSMLGLGATQAAAIVGYGMITINGYEY